MSVIIPLHERQPLSRHFAEGGSGNPDKPGRAFVVRRGSIRNRTPRDQGAGPRTAGTILVADSNLISRDRIAQLLASQGYKVIKASNGLEALALIQLGAIDLLVSAVIMTGMDGLELLRALRDLEIELPAIAVSSGNEAIDKIYLKGASLLGAARTCLQPMRSSVFLDDVRDLLNPPEE